MNAQPNSDSEQGAKAAANVGLRQKLFSWVVTACVVATIFGLSPAYVSHLLVMMGIYLLLAYSLNLVMGFGGLIVFCHAMFYGVGAYAYALARLSPDIAGPQAAELVWMGGWAFLPGVLFAAAVGAILAGGAGWICLKFRGEQFIFATLGFQMIVFVVLYNWVGFSRGPSGLYGIPRPSALGWLVSKPWEYVILVGIVVAGTLPALFRFYRSPFGLALQTMREDERAARAMGVNTSGLALRAIVVAGGVAGLAGALYAGYVTYIDPTSFSLEESIFLVTLLMVGGGGNIRGPLVGVAVMLALPELLRFVGMPDAVAANTRKIIYGALLAGLMYWRPRGLAGTTTTYS